MIDIDYDLTPADLSARLRQLFELAGRKIVDIENSWDAADGTPVFTVEGRYTTRGWTEWTQGFQFGSAVLQYDVTGDAHFLELGRRRTVELMAGHVSHVGVHDHGFNNVSTYGNLLRLMREGRIPANNWEQNFYELALKLSGAVQAARWTDLPNGLGYIYSFNGPHSLFSDTIRSLRVLAMGDRLGHVLMGEKDQRINLLDRAWRHAETTAQYNESIFNLNDGSYRCPSTQQGYTPFSTWTRGHAWILCGYPEQLEFIDSLPDDAFDMCAADLYGSREAVTNRFIDVAVACADFYISETPTDGIPYWDTGAPGLAYMEGYRELPADPCNAYEPVDSSAAAISAQGLIRLGRYLNGRGRTGEGSKYLQAGLTVARRLFEEPYLSTDDAHQGLILHSIYHRPNGWDHVPEGQSIPCGESSMWGDYHALELGVLLHRLATDQPYYAFFS